MTPGGTPYQSTSFVLDRAACPLASGSDSYYVLVLVSASTAVQSTDKLYLYHEERPAVSGAGQAQVVAASCSATADQWSPVLVNGPWDTLAFTTGLVSCSSTCTGTPFGAPRAYSLSSPVCAAAIQQGVVTSQSKTVKLSYDLGASTSSRTFPGTVANGITSVSAFLGPTDFYVTLSTTWADVPPNAGSFPSVLRSFGFLLH